VLPVLGAGPALEQHHRPGRTADDLGRGVGDHRQRGRSPDIRNNLICYTNPDSLGIGLWLNDASRVDTLVSDTNWACSTDESLRSFAWNGSRTTLAGWQAAKGEDGASLLTTPAAFDAYYRVVSTNYGRRRGQRLGLKRD
jgi:hypothetical protein